MPIDSLQQYIYKQILQVNICYVKLYVELMRERYNLIFIAFNILNFDV